MSLADDLESTERELRQVRGILRAAVENLVQEFGARAFREGAIALQFQDLSDGLLASAQRRIALVRAAIGPQPSDTAENS